MADLAPLLHRLTTVTLAVRMGAAAQPVPPPVADLAPLLHRLTSVTLAVRMGAAAQPVPPPVADLAPLLHRLTSVTLAWHRRRTWEPEDLAAVGGELVAEMTAKEMAQDLAVMTQRRRAAISSVWVAGVRAAASTEVLAAVGCEFMAEATAVTLAIASSVARRLCCRR
ncbi:hypothetical protein I4F81_012389 [Pyropia yezoensis]|uniref:Uncharacterized protein n=1 Tax=Pyropia yezoensis TaxID=2788 RepID=A0ACC3CIC7_PYRYE|nr:hypothetical protein I4F81_012389 [Neopyropia yezoensis]